MTNSSRYLIAGGLLMLAIGCVAPSAGVALSFAGRPTLQESAPQTVNRAEKADRLPLPVAKKPVVPTSARPTPLIGCEPVMSPLSKSAQPNSFGHCLA